MAVVPRPPGGGRACLDEAFHPSPLLAKPPEFCLLLNRIALPWGVYHQSPLRGVTAERMEGTRPFPGFQNDAERGACQGASGRAAGAGRGACFHSQGRRWGPARPTWLLRGLALGRRGLNPPALPGREKHGVSGPPSGEPVFKVGTVISKGETLPSPRDRDVVLYAITPFGFCDPQSWTHLLS